MVRTTAFKVRCGSKPVSLGVSKCFPVCPRKRTSDLRVNEYTAGSAADLLLRITPAARLRVVPRTSAAASKRPPAPARPRRPRHADQGRYRARRPVCLAQAWLPGGSIEGPAATADCREGDQGLKADVSMETNGYWAIGPLVHSTAARPLQLLAKCSGLALTDLHSLRLPVFGARVRTANSLLAYKPSAGFGCRCCPL